MRMLDSVIFMDDPDEANVGLWENSLSDSKGIMLEFIKNDRNEEPKDLVRISIGNLADALELAHLIEKTVRPR